MPFFSSTNHFETQHPGEKVLLLTRKHWFVLVAPIVLISLLVILPFAIYFFIRNFDVYQDSSELYWFLVSVYFLFVWNFAFYTILIYVLNTIIVTNERVIENEQLGLFNHNVSEIPIEKVQDISVHIVGVIPTFLNFGNIDIQSAGSTKKFEFTNLPNPKKIKDLIIRLHG